VAVAARSPLYDQLSGSGRPHLDGPAHHDASESSGDRVGSACEPGDGSQTSPTSSGPVTCSWASEYPHPDGGHVPRVVRRAVRAQGLSAEEMSLYRSVTPTPLTGSDRPIGIGHGVTHEPKRGRLERMRKRPRWGRRRHWRSHGGMWARRASRRRTPSAARTDKHRCDSPMNRALRVPLVPRTRSSHADGCQRHKQGRIRARRPLSARS